MEPLLPVLVRIDSFREVRLHVDTGALVHPVEYRTLRIEILDRGVVRLYASFGITHRKIEVYRGQDPPGRGFRGSCKVPLDSSRSIEDTRTPLLARKLA